MQKRLVAASAVLLFALAGCGAKDPTGVLEPMPYSTPVDGTVAIFYQPFNSGGSPFPPTLPVNATCAQNNPAAPPDPTGTVRPCKGPYTAISVTLANPLETNGGTYQAFLTGPGKAPFPIGTLEANGMNATVSANVTQDLSGQYDKVEVRLDDFLYAVASAGSGPASPDGTPVQGRLTLAAGVNGVTATGTFVGSSLEVTVAGLPATNGTYMGNLYLKNADGSTAASASESFPIARDGTYTYESKTRSMADFAEFHVHVGMSKLNVYKASVKVNG